SQSSILGTVRKFKSNERVPTSMSRHKISLPLLILCAVEFLVWHSVFVCGEGQIHADFLQKQQSLLSKINAAKYQNPPEKCAFMGGKNEERPSVYDGPPVKVSLIDVLIHTARSSASSRSLSRFRGSRVL